MTGGEQPFVTVVCRGGGGHRERAIGRWFAAHDGWTWMPATGVDLADTGRAGVHRDDRGTWHLRCPSCRRPARRLSATSLARLLDAAGAARLEKVDLACLHL